jgi:hypothetical protein
MVGSPLQQSLHAQEPKPLHGSPIATTPPNQTGYHVHGVDDNAELQSALAITGETQKWLTIKDNIVVPAIGSTFNLDAIGDLVIDLGLCNLQSDSSFVFQTTGGHLAKVNIIGSSMIANVGFALEGKIELNYFGAYHSGRADILANTTGDDITFNLTGKDSLWDATNVQPKFINLLPADSTGYDNGTIVIGELGTATANITSGNDVISGEVVVGAQNGSIGTLNLSGIYEIDDQYNPNSTIIKPTTWDNTGTIYIGYEGTGTANIDKGAVLKTGSIGVGIRTDGGNGTLNVTGIGNNSPYDFLDKTKNQTYIIPKGTPLNSKDHDYIVDAEFFNPETTHIYIYGRDDEDATKFLAPSSPDPDAIAELKSAGTGLMKITQGAIIEFDETKVISGEPTNFTPKITLGEGASLVDNSIIIGARDAERLDDVTNPNSPDLDDPDLFDDVGLIDGMKDNTTFNNNSLTFTNNAVLQGNLKIYMQTNKFEKGAVLSPGFGSYQFYMPSDVRSEHEKFGRIELKNETFTQESNANIIIDFDVHGDRNYGSDSAKQTAYPLGGDSQPYADNNYYRGRDLITVDGNGTSGGDAELKGDIYFRPQTGYYSDNIKVDFMRATGAITYNDATLHLYPYRWFKTPSFLHEADVINGEDYLNLSVARNTTPFTDVAINYNQRGVGGALNNIFNAQSNHKWLPILDWMWLMNDDELREAERLLGGEIKASSFYLPIRSPWRFGFDRVNWSDKGHKIYFGPQNYNNPQTQKHTLWATAYFDYQSIDDDHNTSAMSTQRVSLMTGYDRVLPASFDVGIFSDSSVSFLFSYAQPKLDQKGCRVIANDYLAAFHSATRILSTYELKSWLGIGTQTYKLHRKIPIPNQIPDLYANYKGNSASGSIQIARPIKWYGLTFRPHAAFDLSYVKQYNAHESFNGEVMKQTALQYHSSDWTQFFARTGLRLDYSRNCINLNATLGYSYLLLGEQAPKTTHEFIHAGGGKFNILGNNLNRSFVNVDLGTQLHLNKIKTRSLYLQYNGNYSKYMNAHTTAIGYQFMY